MVSINSIYKIYIGFVILFINTASLYSQNIYYSNPLKEIDTYDETKFFIIGKVSGKNVLIAKKSIRGFFINTYDEKMNLVNSVNFKEIDPSIEIINIINLNENAVMFLKKRGPAYSFIYFIALNSTGVPIGELNTLDTINTNARIHINVSDNKKYISYFCKDEKDGILQCKQSLISNDLLMIKHSFFNLENNDYNFNQSLQVDNNGNIYTIRYQKPSKPIESEYQFIFIPLESTKVLGKNIDIKKLLVKEMKFNIDNLHHEVNIYSLSFNKGNEKEVEGLFFIKFNSKTNTYVENYFIKFDTKTLPNFNNFKMPLNLSLIYSVPAKDSSFFIFMEETLKIEIQEKTVSPNISPGMGLGFNSGMTGLGLNMPIFSNTKTTTFLSGDLVILRLKNKKIMSVNKIIKRQESKDFDNANSFFLLNNNKNLHVFFNEFNIQNSSVLNNIIFFPFGEIKKIALVKKLNKHYNVYVRESKQVDANTIIAPATVGDILCFVKIKI